MRNMPQAESCLSFNIVDSIFNLIKALCRSSNLRNGHVAMSNLYSCPDPFNCSMLLNLIFWLTMPLDIQCHLVDSCISPILLYGSEVWGHANIKQVEVFHNQLSKQILYLGRRTANCIPRGELGRFTMAHFVKQRMLNYWANLVNRKQSKLSSIVYSLFKKCA